jgi:hypothetical protein
MFHYLLPCVLPPPQMQHILSDLKTALLYLPHQLKFFAYTSQLSPQLSAAPLAVSAQAPPVPVPVDPNIMQKILTRA